MIRLIFLLGSLISMNCFAGVVLDDLTQAQFDKISKEFSANFVHTTVSSPRALGNIFGIEFGVIGGVVKSPELAKIATSVDPSATDVDKIPHAALMAQVSIPYGISFEATMFPNTETADVSLKTFTFAGKWTLTQGFWSIPFVDIAIRAHAGSSELSYKSSSTVVNLPVNSTVTFDTSSKGVNLSVGLSLLIFKPYAGIGYVTTDSTLGATSTTSIFNSSFTEATSATTKHSSSHLFVGVVLDMIFMRAGIEYAELLDTTKVTGKVSIGF